MTEDPPKRKLGRPKKKPAPQGEKPNLTPEQWLGLEREIRGCDKEWRKDGWPSSTSARLVAEATGVSPRAVEGWRNNPEYLRGLHWLISEKLTRKLNESDESHTEQILTERQRAAEVHAFVKQKWTGSVQTPIAENKDQPEEKLEEPQERKVFSSVDEYVAHLLKHGVLPMPDE